MEKELRKVLERNLEQKHFEDAIEVIEGGKENGGLTNVELVENLVESFKGKTVQAPIEVIVISTLFLNVRELAGTIEALKHTLNIKIAKELKERVDKGEVAEREAMALMLAAIMKKESEKD